MTDIALAPGVAKASKRGRKAGTKVPSIPWTAAEEAQLNSLVHTWSPIEPKKALWLLASKELGTHRTPASCEQHFYYMARHQRAQLQSCTPVSGGLLGRAAAATPNDPPHGFAELPRRDFQGVTLAAAAVGAATGTAAAMGTAAQLGELQRATAHNAMGAAQVAAASAGVAVGGGSQLGEVI